jgi:hypothetical protein
MFSRTIKKPARISRDDVAKIAAQGVERALEARRFAGQELTPDQADQVSGAIYPPGIPGIHGGFQDPNALI